MFYPFLGASKRLQTSIEVYDKALLQHLQFLRGFFGFVLEVFQVSDLPGCTGKPTSEPLKRHQQPLLDRVDRYSGSVWCRCHIWCVAWSSGEGERGSDWSGATSRRYIWCATWESYSRRWAGTERERERESRLRDRGSADHNEWPEKIKYKMKRKPKPVHMSSTK